MKPWFGTVVHGSKLVLAGVVRRGASQPAQRPSVTHRARTQVHLDPGKEADFTVELLPRFSSPVEARLTFWAARNKGGMAPASNMVFALK